MITLNPNIKAASRKDAFHIIEQLMLHNQPLDLFEAEKLYKYFMPKTKSKVAKSAIEWCAKAVSKKDIHEMLRYLYSDGKRLMATDGHRLHVIETDLDEGYYCPHTFQKVDLDTSYPTIDRIIPDYKKLEFVDLSTIETKSGRYITKSINGVLFQEKYLFDASNNNDLINIAVNPECVNAAAYGESEFGFFVIMPTRE